MGLSWKEEDKEREKGKKRDNFPSKREKRIFLLVITVPFGLVFKRGSGGEWREKE